MFLLYSIIYFLKHILLTAPGASIDFPLPDFLFNLALKIVPCSSYDVVSSCKPSWVNQRVRIIERATRRQEQGCCEGVK